MKSDRTTTAVMVTLLDLSGLEKKALEVVDRKRFPKVTHCVADSPPHGIVLTPKGLFALCNEGVGNETPISAEHKYEIDFHASYNGGGYCFPAVTASLNDKELRSLATDSKVNLADFIRQFGARLEANYGTWRRVLEEALAS